MRLMFGELPKLKTGWQNKVWRMDRFTQKDINYEDGFSLAYHGRFTNFIAAKHSRYTVSVSSGKGRWTNYKLLNKNYLYGRI